MKLEFGKPNPEHEALLGVREFLAALEITAAYVTDESTVDHFCDLVTGRYGNARVSLEELSKRLGVEVAANDLVIDVLARMRNRRLPRELVAISGVWLRSNAAGNEVEVLIERGGVWCKLGTERVGDGVLSHIWEPAGLLKAPVDEL